MNLSFKELICPNHREENPINMVPHGGQFGGRVNSINMRCPECGLILWIIPIDKEYQYSIKATTVEERRQELIDKAIQDSKKELYEKIQQIKEYKL